MDAFELRRAGETVPAEPQVLSLLFLFAENRNRLLTKDEIVEKIWDGRAISDAALSSRIKSARQLLGDDGKQQRFIKTVHGKGFRFVGDVAPSPYGAQASAADQRATDPDAGPEQEIRFFADRNGTSIAYSLSGSGPVLISPPWWVTHVEADWNVPDVRRFYATVGRGHTLVRYDRPGTGLSDPIEAPFTFESEVALFEDVVAELDAENISILGLSCSGPVAIYHAANHPGQVEKLCFFGAYANGPAISPPEVQKAMLSSIKAHWGLGSRQIADAFLPDLEREQVLEFANQLRRAADAETAAAMLKLVYQLDATDCLARVKAPTLIMHRRGDRAVPFSEARDMAKHIAGATLIPLEGRAHSPWYDDGKIAEKLHDFLVS